MIFSYTKKFKNKRFQSLGLRRKTNYIKIPYIIYKNSVYGGWYKNSVYYFENKINALRFILGAFWIQKAILGCVS